MATLQEAAELVKRDPPVAFVSIAVASARPPNKGIVVETKGRSLLLPDWSAGEWAWYLNLAIGIANHQSTVGDTALVSAKSRALAVATAAKAEALSGDATAHPSGAAAFRFYDAAVRLVLASNAAGVGESRGSQAVDAFVEALKEAPRTVVDSLREATAVVAQESAKILSQLFDAVVTGLLSGGVFIAIGVGLYLWWKSSRRSEE